MSRMRFAVAATLAIAPLVFYPSSAIADKSTSARKGSESSPPKSGTTRPGGGAPHPKGDAHKKAINHAAILAMEHKFPQAIRLLSEMIGKNPKDEEAYQLRGSIYQMTGAGEAALQDLNQAIKLNPKDPHAYSSRAMVYEEQGKAKLARYDRATYEKLDPRGAARMKALQKRLEDGVAKRYVGGLKGRDKIPMVSLHREGSELVEKNQFKAAIEKFTAAIKRYKTDKKMYTKPKYAVFAQAGNYSSRAYCYLMLKNYEAAIKDLSTSIVLCPDFRDNYINRAKAYELTGKRDLASKDIVRVKQLDERADRKLESLLEPHRHESK